MSPENDVYNELVKKINSVVRNNGFSVGALRYYDEERELITVNSDQEIRLAISTSTDRFNNLKMSAQMIPAGSEQRSATNSTCDNGPSARFHPVHETRRLANEGSCSSPTPSCDHDRRHDHPHCCRLLRRPSSIILSDSFLERNETSQRLVNQCYHVPAYASVVDGREERATSLATNASTPIACSVATPTDSDTDAQRVSMIASILALAITSAEEPQDRSDPEENERLQSVYRLLRE